MENMESQRGGQGSPQEPGNPGQKERRNDRRMDSASLFGGYSGPERRSGRDRRASA